MNNTSSASSSTLQSPSSSAMMSPQQAFSQQQQQQAFQQQQQQFQSRTLPLNQSLNNQRNLSAMQHIQHPTAVHQMYSPNGNAYQYKAHPGQSPQGGQPQQQIRDEGDVLLPGGRQPLYANAPPKPRRLNSNRDDSDSERLEDEELAPLYQQQIQ